MKINKIIYNATIRYDFKQSSFSSVTGLEYNPANYFLIGLENIYLVDNIKRRYQREKKHNEFKNKKDFENYYSDLTSQNYLFFIF